MNKIRGIKTLLAMAQSIAYSGMSNPIAAILQNFDFVHRGHGGNHRAQGSRMKVCAKMRRHRSKYQSHQGAREIARRIRSERVSRPRRVWEMDATDFINGFLGTYKCSKRTPLARLRFARWCPITLRAGGAA